MILKTLKANSTNAITKVIDSAAADIYNSNRAIVCSSISQKFNSDVTLFGGMAGNKFALDSSVVCTNDWYSDKCLFTYGQIRKLKIGKPEFHNNTCCVVALKEKA